MTRYRLHSATLVLFVTILGAACSAHRASRVAEVRYTPIPRYEPRFGRTRPLIAVLGDNEATETTDYVVPYGILAESGVADTIALSSDSGPIQMRPALRFRVHATITEFDARYPQGADYVIVPNIYRGAEKPKILNWVRSQSQRGATIVGICDGVPVLANAGLLDGKQATAHWRTIDKLEREHPNTWWLRNRRYVADGNVITTSGVSASIPISIALVEAIAGRERAQALATRLSVGNWSAVHNSRQFHFGGKLWTAALNRGLFWRHESLGIEVGPGVDEISLALAADLYSRTQRSWVYSVGRSSAPLSTRHGLTLLPDREAGKDEPDVMLPALDRLPAAKALDRSLEGIEARYGRPTAKFVATQIEYAWNG